MIVAFGYGNPNGLISAFGFGVNQIKEIITIYFEQIKRKLYITQSLRKRYEL